MSAHSNRSPTAVREQLASLLKSHSREFEEALIARFRSSDAGALVDGQALAGLRTTIAQIVPALVLMIEEGESWTPTVHPETVAQIQYAARHGVPLESVLNGYSQVGMTLLEFFSDRIADLPNAEEAMLYMISLQKWGNDRTMAAFAAVYAKEVERLERLPSRKTAEQVASLLAGGSGRYLDLNYRLDAWHLGLIAVGARPELECRRIAEQLGVDLHLLSPADDTTWAWFGASRRIEFTELERIVIDGRDDLSLGAGEARYGLDGWRLTHREAHAAVAVALLEPHRLVRHSDVALLAAAFRNELTGVSLLDRYLKPLDAQRDGETLRKTLSTYFELDYNAASTAAALGVDRHTIQRRLRKVETTLGVRLSQHRPELEVALRLERLTDRTSGVHSEQVA